ncbi:MAG: hypothetical protein RI947_1277 [Candidatus Parcubacteria bacterium]|jgi:LmbE family N-acetylglucosaminyl deacetylase
MKRTIVGIFAHPDDEAFGPGGSLALYARNNNVYLICVTDGESEERYKTSEHSVLKDIRDKELLLSAKVLGVKEVFFMGYKDGALCNNLYHEIADSIQQKLDMLKPDTIITFEPRGISGHIDHIAVAMIATFLWERLSYIKKIMYYCISKAQRAMQGDYFIHFPPGYEEAEVDEVLDVSSEWEKKLEAINKHVSQKADVETFIRQISNIPKKELFLVKEK